MVRTAILIGLAISPFFSSSSLAADRELDFAERVAAERTIMRFYHSHRIGTTRSFDEAVSDRQIEERVRRYAVQGSLLARRWNTPITRDDLRSELERMVAKSADPERLDRLFDELGRDAFLIQETLVRRVIADRLIRDAFEKAEVPRSKAEPRLMDAQRVRRQRRHVPDQRAVPSSWEAWWAENADHYENPEIQAVADRKPLPAFRSSQLANAPCRNGWLDTRLTDFVPFGRFGHSMIWTGSEVIVWGGSGTCCNFRYNTYASGARYDPATDTWRPMSTAGAPHRRLEHTAVWTGKEMIVWGGRDDGTGIDFGRLNTGGRYDPATDTWAPTSMANVPQKRAGHSATWTGSKMVVWGGAASFGGSGLPAHDTGGLYDPETDRWMPTSMLNAPTPRQDHTAVWTGSEIIVFGGWAVGSDTRAGARYDPEANTWRPLSQTGSGSFIRHTAIWTGTQMVVLSSIGTYIYDEATDSWERVDATRSRNPIAAWSGSEVLVWTTETLTAFDPRTRVWRTIPGGRRLSAKGVWAGDEWILFGRGTGIEGQAYSPTTGLWRFLPRSQEIGSGTKSAWTGAELVVSGSGVLDIYDPMLDSWTRRGSSQRIDFGNSLTWTGEQIIDLAGGYVAPNFTWSVTSSGRFYDPLTDEFSPMPPSPTPRMGHHAVWTGDRLFVWGGFTKVATFVFLTTSAESYDPVTNTWTEEGNSRNQLSGRFNSHSLIHDGEIYFWGGSIGEHPRYPIASAQGAAYDLASKTWRMLSRVNAPSRRLEETGVWTGSELIVWGGRDSLGVLDDGASYDPATDTWTPLQFGQAGRPLPGRNVPSLARAGHAAVWTGEELVLWGGRDRDGPTASGLRIDPHNRRIVPILEVGAPFPQLAPQAFWADGEMILWGTRMPNSDPAIWGGRLVLEECCPAGSPMEGRLSDSLR